MKVLTFNGSPRKGGNTHILLETVLKGVTEAGGRAEVIVLNDLQFRPCQNCGGCDKTGVCILKDDLTPFYKKIVAAKRIIIASPIYFYGVSAQTKAFIDRMQALWSRKRLMKEKGKWRDDPDRKGLFLSVAATRGKRVFEGAVLTARYGYDAMGFAYDGDLLFNGIDYCGDMQKATGELQLAYELGLQFIQK